MSEEILVNVTPPETRVAIIENGVVQEVIVERTKKRGIVGNIYKGKVCRVLPGMQAAFVDAGLERAAFLHASDIANTRGIENPNISDLVQTGSPIIVQVVKDPLGTKGARLTTNLSIPSRYLVFLPADSNIGVSQKIEYEEERTRLRKSLECFVREHELKGGFIARTAAEGVDEMALRADMLFLTRLWESISDKCEKAGTQELVHSDLPLALRALRDMTDTSVEKIRIDSRATHDKAVEFAGKFIPEISAGDKRILLIDGEAVPYALARIPAEGENRGNLAAGASSQALPISEREAWICQQIGPSLRERGLIFVGIDVIGDYLTEINITSPTCIRELDHAFGLNISAQLFECIERKLQS